MCYNFNIIHLLCVLQKFEITIFIFVNKLLILTREQENYLFFKLQKAKA